MTWKAAAAASGTPNGVPACRAVAAGTCGTSASRGVARQRCTWLLLLTTRVSWCATVHLLLLSLGLTCPSAMAVLPMDSTLAAATPSLMHALVMTSQQGAGLLIWCALPVFARSQGQHVQNWLIPGSLASRCCPRPSGIVVCARALCRAHSWLAAGRPLCSLSAAPAR